MKDDLLHQALLFEMHKESYSKEERAKIKSALLKKCKQVINNSGKLFIQSMDDITNL